ncbi:hypothetical protein [Chitinophaga pinensis]|uniref:Lipoprotein n=1 Tax=Chitinophaga pinensis (strain ATCC 43595 / DSM 2588 / LMG 13176 / NBRC 15968 / NCIMB 11800 / UQM 2034) TaxID=485918 RepID=A0A979G0J2_CHIPD|nr:hypothetical protein [Chitinophaga pinensis]ACU58599.1 hypothetical protein Cpin_1101 [Chitinophaga pinensis DSM 2588]
MKLYFVAAALLTMLSCQQSASTSSETEGKDSTVTAPAMVAAGPQCFTRISGKDTSYLQFETDNEVINGHLEYRLFEKDKNLGTITGTINNNIIEAEYRFMSEGQTSVRPVVFKLENNQVSEAIPSSFDKEGVPVFEKDLTKLKYEETPFVKGDCK